MGTKNRAAGATCTHKPGKQVPVPCSHRGLWLSQPAGAVARAGGEPVTSAPLEPRPCREFHRLVFASMSVYLQTQPEGKGEILDLVPSRVLPAL